MLLPPAFGVAAPTQAADAGVHIFNGDGTGTDTVTFRVGGNIVLENVVSPIQYTVNADCTGTDHRAQWAIVRYLYCSGRFGIRQNRNGSFRQLSGGYRSEGVT